MTNITQGLSQVEQSLSIKPIQEWAMHNYKSKPRDKDSGCGTKVNNAAILYQKNSKLSRQS